MQTECSFIDNPRSLGSLSFDWNGFFLFVAYRSVACVQLHCFECQDVKRLVYNKMPDSIFKLYVIILEWSAAQSFFNIVCAALLYFARGLWYSLELVHAVNVLPVCS